MIKLIRVDDRLVHGQVAFTWVPALGVDCILIANDKVAMDEFMKMTLGLAKPAGTKLFIKPVSEAAAYLNGEKSVSQRILVLINNIADAWELVRLVQAITSINFGGLRMKAGARMVSRALALSVDDIALVRKIAEENIELEVRQVPTDKKILIDELLLLPKN